jgi:outer membrane lipoprotein-sorting protein
MSTTLPRRLRRPAIFLGLAAALLLPAAPARAETAEEILSKADDALNRFTDAVWESKLIIREPGGRSREFDFTTYQKLPDKRLAKFNAPGEVKGMGVLVLSQSTLYVFLPGFQRVRRLGSHVKNQTFMGSDFSFEDVGQLRLGTTYSAQLAGADDAHHILDLSLKPGQDTEFPRVKLWVDKKSYVMTRFEYYDKAGTKQKTQIRTDFKSYGAYSGPGKVTMIDHRRNDHTSEIVFLTTKLNSGLSDDVFTVRALSRGQ